jgi:hypothetical protein
MGTLEPAGVRSSPGTGFVQGTPVPSDQVERKLAAIMFTDIVCGLSGRSLPAREEGARTGRARCSHAVHRPQVRGLCHPQHAAKARLRLAPR